MAARPRDGRRRVGLRRRTIQSDRRRPDQTERRHRVGVPGRVTPRRWAAPTPRRSKEILMTETQTIELRTPNPTDRVALRGVRLTGRVAGMSLKATLEQTFVNLEPRAIEAVYTFPLPENAAVCG